MPTSQFIVYSSADPGNGSDQPGPLLGTAGDLLRILDKCLVNGYTGKTAAGWTKPIANSGNIGVYKNSGSAMTLLINDNGPNVTSTFKEAWATGWESVASIAAPVGTGTGQFPTPAQLLTTGHVVVRKSATADSTARNWLIYADAYTFYLFIRSEGETFYTATVFGDIYSLKGSADLYRCILMGQFIENAVPNNSNCSTHLLGAASSSTTSIAAAQSGHYMPRSYTGGGSSVSVLKMGDNAFIYNISNVLPMSGLMSGVNWPDNSLYLPPIRIGESATSAYRGRLRGCYHVLQFATAFTNGGTFNGSNDLADKTFTTLIGFESAVPTVWCIETSATVETN